MSENQQNEAPATIAPVPSQAPAAPTAKNKPKPEKVRLRLIKAGSINYNGLIMRKGEEIELEAQRAGEFLSSGLFEKI